MHNSRIWSISVLVLVSGLAVLHSEESTFLSTPVNVPGNTAIGCFFSESGCMLKCNGVEKDVRQEIVFTFEKYSITTDLEPANCTVMTALQINNSTFPRNDLQLVLFKSVYELEIKDSIITYIDQEAFAAPAFETTFSVTLERINVKQLQGGVLLGLAKLAFLTIISPLEQINRSFFQPVRTCLERLRLSGMTSDVRLADIFGISRMISLKHLDLSHNDFGVLSNKDALANLPALRYLRMEGSNIRAIAVDIFEPISPHLRTLDLSDNKLTTITPDIFSSLLCKRGTFIYLEGNNWKCNCSLMKFAELLRESKEIFVDMLYCRKPKAYAGKLIVEVNYTCTNGSHMQAVECEEEETTSSEITEYLITDKTSGIRFTTTPMSTAPPTTTAFTSAARRSSTVQGGATGDPDHNFFGDNSKNDDLVHITCGVAEHRENGKHGSQFEHVHVGVPLYEFSIQLVSKNSIVINVEDFDSFPAILWYDSPERYKIRNPSQEKAGCKLYDERHVLIGNLAPNTTYTFCLVPIGDSVISPFNCQPFYIPALPPNEEEVWLTHEEKVLAISLYCILIVCCFCVGGIISYLVVCENPTLLKGSKHVFIVEECDYEKIYGRRQDKIFDIYDSRKYTKSTPPPPYEKDEVSLYEVPVKLSPYSLGADTKEDITYSELCPKSPPPVPRRECEIYTVVQKY